MKKLVMLLMIALAIPALADTQNFEGLGLPFTFAGPLTLGNATFSSNGSGTLRYAAFGVGGSNGLGTNEDTNTLTISFASAVNFASVASNYSAYTINFLDAGNNIVCTATEPDTGNFSTHSCAFAGISSIQVLDLDNDGQIVVIDDLVTDYQATPEPGSLALLGSGLVGLGGAIRRKLIA